ncbi:Tyrosine recombinase XerC [subsurface metagenome]
MRLFRPTYKSKGKTKQIAKWWIEFRDPNSIVRKWGLGTTNRDVADIVARQIDCLNEWAKKHIDPPDELVKWVRRQAPKFREKIEKAGLLPASQIGQSKPITEHLEDYRNDLLARNNTDEYAYQVEGRIARIIDACGFRFWSDLDGAKINECVKSFSELSNRTKAYYILRFRQFAKWLHAQGRISSVPAIQGVKFDTAPQRAFELDEWPKLLEATRNGPVRFKLTGHERYVLYSLGMETGLRADELRSLTPVSFDFNRCTVCVSGKHTKNGREALQSITPETAALIKELAKGKMPNVKLFKITSHAADMIRADCEAAGIELENHKGKIKFHSLRHTTGTFLAAKGVLPKDLQEIMRHSKIDLTMSLYTHVLRGSADKAVNKLRGIGQKPAKAETA